MLEDRYRNALFLIYIFHDKMKFDSKFPCRQHP